MFAIFVFTSSLILHPSSLVASPIANVEYVHKYIERATGITIPYKTQNIKAAANVKYLLAALDRANDLSPASTATNLQNHTLATEQSISVDSVWDATKRLYNCDEIGYKKNDTIDMTTGKGGTKCMFVPEFSATLTGMAANSTFSFTMSAAGSFAIDWGDGSAVQKIIKSDTTNTTYTHTYTKAGTYKVGLAGDATEYSTATDVASISFNGSASKDKMTAVGGDLGLVFPYAANLRFYNTFSETTNLKIIPATLFAGVKGAPISYMFYGAFFKSGITSLPSGLFANINGAPAPYMFYTTFYECDGLKSIPENLFGKFTGAPAAHMFNALFYRDDGLTSIADGMWDLSGMTNVDAAHAFRHVFSGLVNVTSPTPKIAKGSTVELWTKFSNYTGQFYTFQAATKMSNYASIPTAWK